jgi:hypothetical protein
MQFFLLELFSENVTGNEKNASGNTSFHSACYGGHEEIVEKMLNTHGFNSLNEKNVNGMTPFHLVCSGGHRETVEKLLRTPGFNSLNDKDTFGQTPFYYACSNNHTHLFELLVTTFRFDSFNEKNIWGETAFDSAKAHGKREITELLFMKTKFNLLVSYSEKNKIINNFNTPSGRYLVGEYNKNPINFKKKRGLALNIHVDKCVLVILIKSGYFKIKDNYYFKSEDNSNNSLKFFKITEKLPTELVEIIINRSCESSCDLIPFNILKTTLIKYMQTI